MPLTVTSELNRRVRALAEPDNYWRGRTPAEPLRPVNILVFRRRSVAELRAGADFPHQHHRHVLITALRGAGRVGVDTRVWPVREGQSLLVLPFQTHWHELPAAEKILWLFVTFEHGRDARLERLRDRGQVSLTVSERDLPRDFIRAWSASAETLGLRLSLWLHALTQKINRAALPNLAVSHAKKPELVAEINRLFFADREKTLRLAHLAKRLRVSVSLLRAEFHRATGKSVGKYVRELKLQYGCELLHDMAWPVGEVATRCGYDSVFSFSRAFHRRYQMSPSRYRQMVGARATAGR
ncbi:MAG: AraC family transcriptional regulator [Verrucomicrobiales bacterium]|jgi:AraC-like DNA-binding protein|nr:AraC family transcriptional regulator [Verrucomicrobiales bacterium]